MTDPASVGNWWIDESCYPGPDNDDDAVGWIMGKDRQPNIPIKSISWNTEFVTAKLEQIRNE